MRVKIVNQAAAAGLLDPQTKRSPFIDAETGAVIEIAEVPENNFWVRRVMHGEVVRLPDAAPETATPTGREPIAPLTTRTTR